MEVIEDRVNVADNDLALNFDSISDILKEYSKGKMVVILDDEDRENEGDLLIAAEKVTAQDINFMAKFGRGLICLTLTEKRCQQLNLPLMVSNSNKNNAPFGTRFTVSVEAAHGVTTGISAQDRATTIKACIKDDASKDDIVQPGHIFPIMAQPGGVLTRPGHTEAGCDLARLAGFSSAASVLVEILNEDGSMARRDDLVKFAKTHHLKIGTIADLIKHRLEHEKTVENISQINWPTEYGEFTLNCYSDQISGRMHYALIKGDITQSGEPYVRVHVENKISDILQFKAANVDTAQSWSLHKAMQYIAKQASGVVLVIANDQPDEDVLAKINNLNTKKIVNNKNYENRVLRNVGIGSQILNDLGITKMKLLSGPVRYYGLSGFNLEVVEYITYRADL